MNETSDLLQQESHFSFGKNWASYAKLVTDVEIAEAISALTRLAQQPLAGRRFLDIGCGSGLHALAAIRLGASEVVAIDLDSDSVATTRELLSSKAPGAPWKVAERSVFSLNPDELGRFDTVYSWGVLHHTGDLGRALQCAAEMVAVDGQFCFALYRRTYLCGIWKAEKKWYARASVRAQSLARLWYERAFCAGLAMTGRSFRRYVEEYKDNRGMDFAHDVHDWLGGWPYESMTSTEVDRAMQRLRFSKALSSGPIGVGFGLLGTGCNEYVYVRS